MKKNILTTAICLSLVLADNSYSSTWQRTKETANQAMFWKSENLNEITFQQIYKNPFYHSVYFTPVIIGASVIAAGTVIYFTAGAGAPAAAAGVSSTAAWIGGGGAGSYMAGLSTVGGWFGGNAILGGAILNGISIGVLGGGTGAAAKLATMTLTSKVLIGINVSAAVMDGVFFFVDPETKELTYQVKLNVPQNIGSGSVRNILKEYNDIESEIQKLHEKGNYSDVEELVQNKIVISDRALDLLRGLINNENGSQEDYLALSMHAWNAMDYDLFNQSLNLINYQELRKASLYHYLSALSEISNGNDLNAIGKLELSIFEEPEAIEPVALYINLLGNLSFSENENKMLIAIKNSEQNFSKRSYASSIGLVSIYFRMGSFYYTNERYDEAEVFFRKALKDIGMIQRFFGDSEIRLVIEMAIANTLFMQGNIEVANEAYLKILKNAESFDALRELQSQYLGWNN